MLSGALLAEIQLSRVMMHGNNSVDIFDEAPEVSIVLPCLNEAETLAGCIGQAQIAIQKHSLQAEIIVADNGSTDGSDIIAEECGARAIQCQLARKKKSNTSGRRTQKKGKKGTKQHTTNIDTDEQIDTTSTLARHQCSE